MDAFAQLVDTPVFTRVLTGLPQKESLALVRLRSEWRQYVGGAFRLLSVNALTPLAAVAVIAEAKGFHRLRELVLDCAGERSPVEAYAGVVASLRASDVQLERIALRNLSFGSDADQSHQGGLLHQGGVSLSVVRFHVRAFEQVVLLARESAGLQRLELSQVPVTHEFAPTAPLRTLVDLFEDASVLQSLIALKITSCPAGLRCARPAVFGHLGAQLRRLDLTDCQLQAGGAGTLAGALPRMLRLEALLLGGNGIGPIGARSLGEGLRALHETLEELDLSENGLGPTGIQNLAGPLQALPKLRVLRLRGGWASSEGVPALLELLRGCARGLEKLDISQNRLGAPAVRLLLAELPDLPELQWLNLSENSFAVAEFAAQPNAANFARLAEAAPKLRELELSGCGLGSCEFALRVIAKGMPLALQSLTLSASKLREQQLRALVEDLPQLLELQSLAMVQAQIDDAALEPLAALIAGDRMPRLHTLDLRGNMVKLGPHLLRQRLSRSSATLRELRCTRGGKGSTIRD